MRISSTWKGSTDPEVKSGLATFDVDIDGRDNWAYFESFADYNHMCGILDSAYERGMADAAKQLRAALMKEFDMLAGCSK